MTPLEEKIEEILQIASVFEKENGIIPITKVLLKQCLESIATQAVEEYKKELLEKLPEYEVEGVTYPWGKNPIPDEGCGFNRCLTQVRIIISKPNI